MTQTPPIGTLRRVPAPASAAVNGPIRLNKRMAELGLCSRREADDWIDRGWVKVNGKVCPADPGSWTYDAASNTVTFNDKGPCMPQAGDKVSIYYKMLCFP